MSLNGQITFKCQMHFAGGAVAVFCNDNLSHAHKGISRVVLSNSVIFRTVNKCYNIGILFNGTRFAQVGKLRAFRAIQPSGSIAKEQE